MYSSGDSDDGRFDGGEGPARKRSKPSKKRKKNNAKSKKKKDKEKRGEKKLVVQKYDSTNKAWCGLCAVNNITQEHSANAVGITIANGVYQGDVKEDLGSRLYVEPDVSVIFAQLVTQGYAGAPTNPGCTIQLASTEQHYHVKEGEPTKLVQGQDLEELHRRGLTICLELQDYTHLPISEYIQKLCVGDQIFFMVDVLDPNHAAAFKNIRKPYFILRVQVYNEADADPAPHFIAFILKGEFYYIYGGEETSPIYKIKKDQAEVILFDEEKRESLLSMITGAWHRAVYCVEGDYVGHRVIFLPKVILRNPSDIWDAMSIREIEELPMWEHPIIDLEDPITGNHPTAHSVVEINDPNIIDVGEAILN